jgi:hypothetical protein
MKVEFFGKNYEVVTINFLRDCVAVIYKDNGDLKMIQMNQDEFKRKVTF